MSADVTQEFTAMKLNYFALSATAIVTFGGVSGLVLNQNLAQAGEMSHPNSHNGAMTKEKFGTFVAAEHPTQGNAKIISVKGKRYIEFDKAFKSEQGPDLHVILYRAAIVPTGGIDKQDYVTLGRLKNVQGTQRYAIPSNVNLANFQSVAVWCRAFNATFGYASLPATAQANR